MRQDNTLLEQVTVVLGYPINLVTPCRWVLPWGSKKDIHIVVLAQLVHSLYGTRHRVHQREDATPRLSALFERDSMKSPIFFCATAEADAISAAANILGDKAK